MGQNEIQYARPNVSFYDVGTQTRDISGEIDPGSEETIISGVRYNWDPNNGFINTGWWGTDVEDGPMQISVLFTESAILQHLEEYGNFNLVFKKWQDYINDLPLLDQSNPVNNFNQALQEHNGNNCAAPL